MPDLIAPTTSLHAAWLDARDDWGPGVHEDGFGLGPQDEVDSPTGFADWVARLRGDPHGTCRWIVEDGRVLGGIAVRNGPAEHVLRMGHIGYGIRPSARRRGLATWALGRVLAEWDLRPVLIVCEVDNLASARTIERHGGVPEATPTGPVRRYWIR